MKVAVLHNLRPELPLRAGLAEDEYEEYDSPDTIDAIVGVLEGMGVAAEPVTAGRDLPRQLDGRYDFVFNIAEGAGGRCREAIPAAVCELLGLPYSGSDPLTLAATLDKAVARRIVSPEVPVARAGGLEMLTYPVIVKPRNEGSSKGIRVSSFCPDVASAERQVRWLADTYGCSVLVEEFLPGMEVTVAIAGNGEKARVLAIMEIAPATPSAEPFIYSLEVKRAYLERVRYRVPPSLPDSTLQVLEAYALKAYDLLGCRDIARIDFRLDGGGLPRFLECNPLPGLNPVSSDIVIATRSVLTYENLIGNILRDAAARHGIPI
jgi:D-alanine-D-alanine ligase